MTLPRSIAPVLLLALVAACNEAPAPGNDRRSATGEVLEGSISDAMLPLDRLRSEPPLLAPEKAPAAGAAGETGDGPDATPGEQPSETPTPEAPPPAAPVEPR